MIAHAVYLGVLPNALLLWLAYRVQPGDRLRWTFVLRLYLLSLFSPVLAVVLEVVAERPIVILPALSLERGITWAAATGLIEEGVKLLVLWRLASSHLRSPYDGVVCALAVALGFATVEDTLLAVGDHALGIETNFLSIALAAMLGHPVYAVVMGTLAAEAARAATMRARQRWLCGALLLPAALHALNNTVATLDLSTSVFCAYLGGSLVLAFLLWNRATDWVPPRGAPQNAWRADARSAMQSPSFAPPMFCRRCLATTQSVGGRCSRCAAEPAPRFLT